MTQRILIVDDAPIARSLLRLILEGDQFQIVEASSGQAALARIAEAQPDLVILDVMMPFVSGLEICERLRRDSKTADIPILIVSAKGHTASIRQGMMAGATSYLTKPISRSELLHTITALLHAPVN